MALTLLRMIKSGQEAFTERPLLMLKKNLPSSAPNVGLFLLQMIFIMLSLYIFPAINARGDPVHEQNTSKVTVISSHSHFSSPERALSTDADGQQPPSAFPEQLLPPSVLKMNGDSPLERQPELLTSAPLHTSLLTRSTGANTGVSKKDTASVPHSTGLGSTALRHLYQCSGESSCSASLR